MRRQPLPGYRLLIEHDGRGRELLAFAPAKLSTEGCGQDVEPRVLSGTEGHVLSGTTATCYQEPGTTEFAKRDQRLRARLTQNLTISESNSSEVGHRRDGGKLRRGCAMIAARFHQDTLTHIELIWHEQQIEHSIRFGRDVAEKILDRRRRILSFAPNTIVAYVRWASGDFGTIVSRIDILRTVRRGEGVSTVPYVRPGGEILLRASGWPKVERVLQAIDAVEQIGIDAADACPDHGGTFTTGLSRAKCRALTAASSTEPGSSARRSTHDAVRKGHDDLLRHLLVGNPRAAVPSHGCSGTPVPVCRLGSTW